MQWLKRVGRENVGKKSSRITHALGNKSYLYFGPIMPNDSCNLMYKNRNDTLLANKMDSVDYNV